MSRKTIGEEISTIAKYEISRTPKPMKCTITKVYSDGVHADVQTTDNSLIKYVETISNNLTVGNTGVLIFFNGDENDYIVITN